MDEEQRQIKKNIRQYKYKGNINNGPKEPIVIFEKSWFIKTTGQSVLKCLQKLSL